MSTRCACARAATWRHFHIPPTPVFACAAQIDRQEAVGERGILAQADKSAGICRAYLVGLPGELVVVQVDRQRVFIQRGAQLLVLGPAAGVDGLHGIAVFLPGGRQDCRRRWIYRGRGVCQGGADRRRQQETNKENSVPIRHGVLPHSTVQMMTGRPVPPLARVARVICRGRECNTAMPLSQRFTPGRCQLIRIRACVHPACLR